MARSTFRRDPLARRRRAPQRPSRLRLWLRRRRGMARPAAFALLAAGALGGLAYGVMSAGVRVGGGDTLAPRGWFASFGDGIAGLGARAGLTVREVVLEGSRNTPPELVREAVGVRRGDPTLGFSPQEARARLESIAWVERAHVERRLPGTIRVRRRGAPALRHLAARQPLRRDRPRGPGGRHGEHRRLRPPAAGGGRRRRSRRRADGGPAARRRGGGAARPRHGPRRRAALEPAAAQRRRRAAAGGARGGSDGPPRRAAGAQGPARPAAARHRHAAAGQAGAAPAAAAAARARRGAAAPAVQRVRNGGRG